MGERRELFAGEIDWQVVPLWHTRQAPAVGDESGGGGRPCESLTDTKGSLAAATQRGPPG